MGHGAMTAEEVKKHVKGYWIVFGVLLCLTAITVAVSKFHLPVFQAVVLAMIVATVKGTLVSLYFMHLISEKTIIYSCLALTAVLLVFLMLVPIFTLYGHL